MDGSLVKVRAFQRDVIPESCASAAIELIEDLRDRARDARQSLKR